MQHCPVCKSSHVKVTQITCGDCGVAVSAEMHTPPLARLSVEHLMLATQLVLHGGNLKTLAEAMEITYPTLRKRLDEVIISLKELCAEDNALVSTILNQMERGEMKSEEGIRRIKEVKNEL